MKRILILILINVIQAIQSNAEPINSASDEFENEKIKIEKYIEIIRKNDLESRWQEERSSARSKKSFSWQSR